MKPKKCLNLFEMSEEEYLDIFPVMNVEVRTQDDGDTSIIDIHGYIGRDIIREWITGEKSPNSIESIKGKLREISTPKIITNINSPGGDLNAGIVIKDMLQSKGARVVTNMMGFSASAATVIAQAGTTRRMAETAFMLPHRAMVGLLGYYNQNTFNALTADLEVIDNALIAMYAKRASISEDEIADLMDEGEGYGRWVDAEESLEKGFVDELYDPADEDDPDTDHLETDDDDESQNYLNKQGMKKAAAFQSMENIEALLGREGNKEQESKQKETAAAEEARSKAEVSNNIFKQIHEVT